MPRGVVPSDGGCANFGPPGLLIPRTSPGCSFLFLSFFTLISSSLLGGKGRTIGGPPCSNSVQKLNGYAPCRISAYENDSLAPLCTAPSFAGCSAGHSNADGCPCGFRGSPRPGVGQGDRGFVLQATSSDHWGRRDQRRRRCRGRIQLTGGYGLVSRRQGDDDVPALLAVRGRSRPTLAVEALAICGVRRGASHGPARLFRHRARHRPGRSCRLSSARNHVRHPRMVSPCSRRPGRWQYLGLHTRSRSQQQLDDPSDRIGVHGRVACLDSQTNRYSADIAALWSSCIPCWTTRTLSTI